MLTLEQCLGAHRPMTFVVAESELEVLKYIYNNYKEDKWFVYSPSLAGLVSLQDLIEKKYVTQNKAETAVQVFESLLRREFGKRNRQFEKYIILDSQAVLTGSETRKVKDVLNRYQLDENFTVNMVFVSQVVFVPIPLQRLGDLVFFDLPNEDELKTLSNHMVKKLELKKHQKPSPEVVNNLRGLTQFEVEQSYLQSYQLYQKIDLNFIRDYKKNAIAKTDLLSLSEVDVSFGDIGGMDNLKEWIKQSYGGWTVEGKKFGLPLLKGLLMVGLPGCGKAQPLDSIVYTPTGSKLMGEMKVGDLVCTPDGGAKKIRSVTPQGEKDIYRIYFRDGATVECCEDHLWEIKIRDKRHKSDKFILPLKKFPSLKSKYDNKTSNISIRVPDKIEFKETKLSVDPYVMGIMIGNGALGNEEDPRHRSIGFTSESVTISRRLRKELLKFDCVLKPKKDNPIQFTVCRINGTDKRNKFKSQLEKYGLLGKKSINKHIPADYLFNSYENRIGLLNGLMDTDGNVVQNGYGTEYSTSSEQLSKDFKLLVESLGGICVITSRESHFTKSGKKVICHTNYRCWPKTVFNPFSLKRKKDDYIPRTKYRKLFRFIEKIEYVGKKEAQCIGLGNDEKLYLTDNFIVTHNSMIMKALGSEWGLPVVDFDPSLIFSSRVGDSEQNMRRVLQIVENMSPCLSGGTMITLSDGQVTSIKELYDNQYRGTVISIDNNFNFDNSDILLITKKQSNDMYNIRTTINNIKATGNHEFPVLRSNGEMHWVEVENLKKGDYIVCPSYKFIKKFHEKASLYHPKKIDHFNLLQESIKEPKCRSDSLDVRECLINLLLEKDFIISVESITEKGRVRKQSIISDKISVESRKIIHDYIEENRIIDIEKIRSVFNELNAGDYWFLNERFFFTSISEKNKIQGNHDVYDLCLNKNHNFIGNRMFTHNCILAIDEIEKGLAGMQSSSFSDSGVTARVIRSFLIWMQECTKPVFVVATANNIEQLPPELINRFDETFFVNIPQSFERKDIFDIHISRLGRDPDKIDTAKLAELSKDLSGREIEQVLREGMYTAFHGKNQLSTEIIAEILEKKTNLITTMAEQLKALLKWVGWDDMKKDGVRARFASPSESLDIGRVHNEIDDILKTIEGEPPGDG